LPIRIGSQLGSYEVTSLLGKGGMGEVYRARDPKLKRDIAVKILSEAFSRDVERLSRFQREAEVLASLNHPNIAGIYDLQEAGDTRFLVLELIEGDTLLRNSTRCFTARDRSRGAAVSTGRKPFPISVSHELCTDQRGYGRRARLHGSETRACGELDSAV
jgi:serine/threonine protein kinase